MNLYKQSESTAARRRVYLHLVDATDGITAETGEASGQPQLSKNGAAFGNTSATLTAIGNGAYYVELTSGELDTLGFALVRYKSANTAEFQALIQVVSFDPYDAAALGLSRIDTTVSSRASQTSLDAVDDFVDTEVAAIKAKTDQLTFTAANKVDATLQAAGDIGAGVITATAIAPDAIGASELASDAANEIADALLDRANGIETSYTLRQAMRLILSACAGKLSGAATTTVNIRDTGDSKNRISATVDADGNRTAVTLDAT